MRHRAFHRKEESPLRKPSPRFGEIYLASLLSHGSVQGGRRPVLIAQNDVGNRHSPVVEVIPISSRLKAGHMPTHTVLVPNESNGLKSSSVVMSEQVQTINQDQLEFRIGSLTHEELVSVGRARSIQSPFPQK